MTAHLRITEQCKSCIFDGRRECIQHGYPEDCIPPSCDFKIGKLAVIAPIEAQLHNREHDAAIAQAARENVLKEVYDHFVGMYLDIHREDDFTVKDAYKYIESLRQYKEQP